MNENEKRIKALGRSSLDTLDEYVRARIETLRLDYDKATVDNFQRIQGRVDELIKLRDLIEYAKRGTL